MIGWTHFSSILKTQFPFRNCPEHTLIGTSIFFCSKDSLTIYKGGVKDENEIISGPLCGDFPNPSQFVSKSNEIFLEFLADSYTTDRGFRIKYNVSGELEFSK